MIWNWLWRHPRRAARTGGDFALYADAGKGQARCDFMTPTKGMRTHYVSLTVDEIEALILAEHERRTSGK